MYGITGEAESAEGLAILRNPLGRLRTRIPHRHMVPADSTLSIATTFAHARRQHAARLLKDLT